METVQKLHTVPYQRGYIDFDGDAEPIDEWIETADGADGVAVIVEDVMGWSAYTHVIEYGPAGWGPEATYYYLIPDELLERMAIPRAGREAEIAYGWPKGDGAR
jgi:hypothetical protein